MKQLIVLDADASYASDSYNSFGTEKLNVIGLYSDVNGTPITKVDQLKNNIMLAYANNDAKVTHFPEIDVKSLSVTKAEYKPGNAFTATIAVPTTEKGLQYTIIIAKKGTKLHERNTWTYTSIAKDNIATVVATDIVKQINANTNTSGITAANIDGAITITAVSAPTIDQVYDYEVIGADELTGVKPTLITPGKAEILGKDYVKDLASRCAASKGFNYLAEDGKELYPGYTLDSLANQYTMYTLRFAVPRMSGKQRDEVVYQTLHIAIPVDSDVIATLDAIFGLSDVSATAAATSVDEGDEGDEGDETGV